MYVQTRLFVYIIQTYTHTYINKHTHFPCTHTSRCTMMYSTKVLDVALKFTATVLYNPTQQTTNNAYTTKLLKRTTPHNATEQNNTSTTREVAMISHIVEITQRKNNNHTYVRNRYVCAYIHTCIHTYTRTYAYRHTVCMQGYACKSVGYAGAWRAQV